MSLRIGVVLVAAGSGTRFGSTAKILANLAGRPVVQYALETLASVDGVCQVVIVAGEHTFSDVVHVAKNVSGAPIGVCLGGETRQDSVRLGVKELADDVELVLIHDAARPFVDQHLIERVIAAAAVHGAAVPALPVSDTLYQVDAAGFAASVQARDTLRAVQTPQVIRRDWLDDALDQTGSYTDEGSALLTSGRIVMTVPGSPGNFKITWPDDLALAEALLNARQA